MYRAGRLRRVFRARGKLVGTSDFVVTKGYVQVRVVGRERRRRGGHLYSLVERDGLALRRRCVNRGRGRGGASRVYFNRGTGLSGNFAWAVRGQASCLAPQGLAARRRCRTIFSY